MFSPDVRFGRGYAVIMLLLSDPAISETPVRECGEDMVDVRTYPGLLVDDRKRDDDGAWTRLRSGLVRRLLRAQQELPSGLRFLIIEGHRPAALQRRYFRERCAELRQTRPQWSERHVREQASQHVSPPEVAPHTCGAAVDLTLVDGSTEVDLGTPVNATPEASGGACFTDAANIDAAARARRADMATALAAEGLVNYPPEWWHWSFGDRYWAVATGAECALYDAV